MGDDLRERLRELAAKWRNTSNTCWDIGQRNKSAQLLGEARGNELCAIDLESLLPPHPQPPPRMFTEAEMREAFEAGQSSVDRYGDVDDATWRGIILGVVIGIAALWLLTGCVNATADTNAVIDEWLSKRPEGGSDGE